MRCHTLPGWSLRALILLACAVPAAAAPQPSASSVIAPGTQISGPTVGSAPEQRFLCRGRSHRLRQVPLGVPAGRVQRALLRHGYACVQRVFLCVWNACMRAAFGESLTVLAMSSTQDPRAVGRRLYLGGSVVRVGLEAFARWLSPLPPAADPSGLPAAAAATSTGGREDIAAVSSSKAKAGRPHQRLRYLSILKYFCEGREDADPQVRASSSSSPPRRPHHCC